MIFPQHPSSPSRILALLVLFRSAFCYLIVPNSAMTVNDQARPDGPWVVKSGSGGNEAFWTGCYNRTAADPSKKDTTFDYPILAQACLDWYYWGGLEDTWEGATCYGLDFFRGSHEYDNSRHCYEACYGCLSISLKAGATNVICRDAYGMAANEVMRDLAEEPQDKGPHCWIGFQKPGT